MKRSIYKGFTLVELIIVIAIIAILAAAIFVAIDPARRLNESRNARRWSDITNIVDGIIKYQVDNEGTHYTAVAAPTAGTYVIIGTTTGDDGLCAEEPNTTDVCANVATATGTAGCVDLSAIGSNYLGAVPADPRDGTAADTSYYLMRNANGAITVGACGTEGEGAGGSGTAPTIVLTR